MALPSKKRRLIKIRGHEYHYVISRSASSNPEVFDLKIVAIRTDNTLPKLIASGLITRDRWLDFPQIHDNADYQEVTPRLVAEIIQGALKSGWQEHKGSQFNFTIPAELL